MTVDEQRGTLFEGEDIELQSVAPRVAGPRDPGLVSVWSSSSEEASNVEEPVDGSSDDCFASDSFVERQRAEFASRLARRGPLGPEEEEEDAEEEEEDQDAPGSGDAETPSQGVDEAAIKRIRRETTIHDLRVYLPPNMALGGAVASGQVVMSSYDIGSNFLESIDDVHQDNLSTGNMPPGSEDGHDNHAYNPPAATTQQMDEQDPSSAPGHPTMQNLELADEYEAQQRTGCCPPISLLLKSILQK